MNQSRRWMYLSRPRCINLLEDLQEQYGLAYLFISHDLSVVYQISDRVAVMYVGKMVELARTETLFKHPLHPYTEALLSALPVPNPRRHRERIVLSGEVANPANPPSGCFFHPRCAYAKDICKHEAPPMREVEPGAFCELSLCRNAQPARQGYVNV